ncbi:hypothetical protein MTR_0586s0030 [Medicago truncatula]|uniref:Uncharacterized protein n=1 Tax=Medicago truncatula TaxID=3880 RepID=A0A072TDX6_MEDTR|nr:hypothetical protein MTR_0586s0030 [Medicago truncatula]
MPYFFRSPGTTPLGVAGHPTNAASSLSFHIVHLGPNASNWWTTKSPRAKKGRPPITRIRTEMDDVETERRCGVCRMSGHSRKDCINIRHQ